MYAGMSREQKQRRVATALGILLACCACALALDPSLDISQYAHTSWKISDGLYKGTIHTIAQTPDGYLWLGTEFGLLRFDGVRMVPWQPPASEHLPNGPIRSLLTSRDGRLWIGTYGGLASWKDGKLTQYPALTGQLIPTLFEDREGRIWVGTEAIPSARLSTISSGSVQCYGEDGRLGHSVISLYQDSRGNVWVGVETGLWRWYPGPPKFYPMPEPVLALTQGDNGALLISMRGGIRQFLSGKVKEYPLPGRWLLDRLLIDRDGARWVVMQYGLLHLHQGRIDVFAQSDGLSGPNISALFEDREGNVWVATTAGLDRFRDLAVVTVSAKQGLSDANHVASVLAARDGSVWVANLDCLNRWQHGQIAIYRRKRSSHNSEGVLNRGLVRAIADTGLPHEVAGSLFQDLRGRIWVSTTSGVVYFENGRFAPLSNVAGKGRFVHSIVEDSAGDVWISADQGLFHVRGGSVVEQISWTKLGRKDFAMTLLADPMQGGLWLGFFNGGVTYFKDGQVRASYADVDGLGNGRVNDFRIDRDGAVWAATEGGLSLLKNGRVATLTSKNGLPCDSLDWAMEDDEHFFWLNMSCGLVRIARTELDSWVVDSRRMVQATVFDSYDGVRSHAFYGDASPRVAKSLDGRLWFSTWDGLSVIDPHNFHDNKLPPAVHIEKITADHKTYDLSSDMQLPARVRDLDIDYTALSLVVPERVRFRVKLEGQDKDWRNLVNVRHVEYTNLPPKRYKFRVLASNNSGVWNEEGATLDFVIPPAWYQTNWFRAACIAAFLAMIWGIHELRVRQVARQFNLRLEERVSERARIARDLHDTLLQSFQGLVLRFQAVRYQLPDRPEKASAALDSALISADQAITEGRKAIQELRSEPFGENNLEQTLLATGRELASAQDGRDSAPPLRVIVEGGRREKRAIIREEIYRIARELLRNAYRHAQAQNIEAELRYGDDAFLLVVRDNGKGMDPKILEHQGCAGHFGLPGIYERAAGIGARLDVWSEAGAGTEVRLTVPAAIAYEKARDGGRFKLFRKARIYEHRS
jgi:signal transduction histidine kinase/streptogramin lyase